VIGARAVVAGLLLEVFSTVLAPPAPALELGASLPLAAHSMVDPDGRRHRIGDVVGERGTLVLFLCVHCPWVQKWSGRIAAIGEIASQTGIGVIALNANDPGRVKQDGVEGMRRQIDEFHFPFPYVVDRGSTVARAFAAKRTPEAYLFDAAGHLAYHGTVDDDAYDADAVESRFLLDAVRAVARGVAPDPAETKAFGCAMKMYPVD